MKFEVHGPYDLAMDSKGLISMKENSPFWKTVQDHTPGLPDACGCYVFRVAGKGAKPCYVGKTETQSFKKECSSPDKRLKYIEIFPKRKRGSTPQLFFLAQIKVNGGFSKPAKNKGSRPLIEELESILIGKALTKNKKLLNVRGTGKVKQIEVKGFLNSSGSGHIGLPAQKLRKTLGR